MAAVSLAIFCGQAGAAEGKLPVPAAEPIRPVVVSSPVPSPSPVPATVVSKQDLPLTSMEMLDDKYKLSPGDKISFRVMEDRDEPKSVLVVDSGDAEIPYIGRVPAAKKSCRQLAQELKILLEKDYYKRATVIISLDSGSRTRGKIFLYGAIRNQGPQDIPTDEIYTVSKAILRAGGFAEFADKRNVEIKRTVADSKDPKTLKVDVLQVLENGKADLDVVVQADDYINVRTNKSKGQIYLSGQVRTPGPQVLPDEENFTLSKAILRAGGFSDFADKKNVKINRKKPDGKSTETITVNVVDILEKGQMDKDVILKPEDYIYVDQRLVNF